MNVEAILYLVSIWALPILLAITLHEAAHGWVAWKLGDDTAFQRGRVTFNPLRHIDLFGTILLPAALLFASSGQFMFGSAKPVPVNMRRLRKPRRDMVLVAAAGPGTNLALAVIAAALLNLVVLLDGTLREWVGLNLWNAVWINLLLAVFNMIPIPPLDGGRVAVGLLPPRLGLPLARLERYGIVVVLAAVFLLPWAGRRLGVDLNVFQWLVVGPVGYLRGAIMILVGPG